MGRKHNVSLNMLKSSTTTISGDMSATITSRIVDTSEMDKGSLHFKWAAGPVGTIQIFVQNDVADTYYPLDFGSTQTFGAGDSEVQIVFTEMPFKLMYFVYTPTSGTGTLSAFWNTKSVGA